MPAPNYAHEAHQVHQQWHRLADDYGDPDDFVTSLNAALVSLRSIPEVLDKEKRYIPDFDTWYAAHDAALRADPLLQWLVKVRNHVVHHGDLELHSRARVRVLVGGRELPEVDINVPPLLDQDEIASLIAPRLSAAVREQGVLAVERRWVAADQPDYELLDVLAHCYGKLAEVVADAHGQTGIIMQAFGDEAHARRPERREHLGGRLSCMVAHAGVRTAYVHLARDRLMVPESRDRELRREDLEGFDPGFAIPNDALGREEGETILAAGERMASYARALIEHAGVHHPMAMIHETRDLPPEIVNLHASDAQEQTLMMESIVEEVERLGAEGVIFISELHSPDGGGGELLVAALTNENGRRVWHTPIERTAPRAVRLGETTVDERVPEFLLPVQRALAGAGGTPAA